MAAILCITFGQPHAASAASPRVMSLSECTDQLVLALLPPARVTSVTWLSRDPTDSPLSDQARQVPINHGTAEEVLRQHPDLVVAGTATTPATRALLRRLGVELIELDDAETWQDIRAATTRLAAAFGVQPAGAALIAHMDAQLTLLAATRAPAIRVIAWDGAGVSARPGSLQDTLLRAAGAVNVANLASAGAPTDAETLLAAAPTLLVEGARPIRRSDLRSNLLLHPLVRRFWRTRTVILPEAAYICGTPYTADAAVHLRHDLIQAVAANPPLSFAPISR